MKWIFTENCMVIHNDRQTEDHSMETMNNEVPCINKSEIKKALKGMSKGKAGGADGLLIDPIKDTDYFFSSNKLAVLFTKGLQNLSYYVSGKIVY